MFSNILAAADPLVVAGSTARAMSTLAKVPPAVGKRARAGREQRRATYARFECAVNGAASAATHLAVLAQVDRPDIIRRARTTVAMVSGLGRLHPALQNLVQGVVPVVRLAVAADFLADAQHRHAVFRAADGAREATAALGAALGELRLVGRPGVQEAAEALIVLLAELFSRVSGPVESYEECLTSLAAHSTSYFLAARKDLDTRWWHLGNRTRTRWWQKWRVPASATAGWEPPDANALIASAQEQPTGR